jgi:hypothetical protein
MRLHGAYFCKCLEFQGEILAQASNQPKKSKTQIDIIRPKIIQT